MSVGRILAAALLLPAAMAAQSSTGTVTELAPVKVAGTTGHMSGFDKRRAQGKGTFFTEEDIRKSKRNQIADLVRSVRGVRVECANGCRVQMVRSTTCEPRYFMNGFPSDAGILQTPVLDVAGIEIYRGPSETPGEFMGAQSMCGAIVVWTK
jgi:outer membrane receptor for ferrienterochelin and colicin